MQRLKNIFPPFFGNPKEMAAAQGITVSDLTRAALIQTDALPAPTA
jgi:hypothetical protein